MDIAKAYDWAAQVYAAKYDQIPPRQNDIDIALEYVLSDDPKVLEIGYGSGRDARYLVSKISRTNYVGVDISSEMQKIALQNVPNTNFCVGDICTWKEDGNYDLVLALASLLHLDENQLKDVLVTLHGRLNQSAIIFISLKRRDSYQTNVDDDGVTSRRFYYYTRKKINELVDGLYSEVYYDEQHLNEAWFTMILRKL